MTDATHLCTSVRQSALERFQAPVSPGVGAHSPAASSLRRSPSFTFATSARADGKRTSSPGPAAYSPIVSTRVPAPATFGTTARTTYSPASTPAPGAYDTAQATDMLHPRSPKMAMARAPRDAGGPRSVSPGPAAYAHPSSTLGTQAVSVRPSSARVLFPRAARGTTAAPSSPGPGAYATATIDALGCKPMSSTRPRSASTRMSTSARFGEGPSSSPTARGGGGSTPLGPAYSPIMAAVLPNAPKFTFARAGRDGRTASSLGSTTGTATGAASSRSPSRSASPGPGAYRTEEIDGIGHKQASSTRAAAPRTVFGSARRPEVMVADTPGPGVYPSSCVESTRPRSARVVFGTSGRFTGAAGGSPGSSSPGPSEYNSAAKSKVLKAAPSITFSTAPRDGGHRTHAGAPAAAGAGGGAAAAYNIDAAMRATRATSPRPLIGTAPRFATGSKTASTATPGPTDYGVPKKASLRASPAYSMKPR